MATTISAPSYAHRPQWMLAAIGALVAVALIVALAVSLGSSDSPAVQRDPAVTTEAPGPEVHRSPDATDRVDTTARGRTQPSRAF
jgi:hypothetical protein